MPIILAIEPDRRQRDALTAVVRHRVGAELILADTTERALEAIGNRVPDLVLVPALLSPTDDAALAAALRVIAAAAHVRTLTIPVLAAQSASESRGGLFSRWRRGSTPQAADGCDPALFAEQIVAYLKESAAERALFAEQEEQERLEQEESAFEAEPQAAGEEPAFAYADTFVDAPPVVTAFTEPEAPRYGEAPRYVEPEMPAATFGRTDGTPAFTRADAEIYTPDDAPVPIYTPNYSYASALFGGDAPEAAAPVEPEALYASEQVPVVAEPEPAYETPQFAEIETPIFAEAETPQFAPNETREFAEPLTPQFSAIETPEFEQVDFAARLREELLGGGAAARYETQLSDSVPTLEIEEEEDIDLSEELAELKGEEETNGEELFDGEPIGIYTMPSLTDEPEFEMPRFTFGRTRVEPIAAPEPRFEARVDPGFIVEEQVESEFDVDVDVEVEVEAAEVEAAELEPAAAFATAAVAAEATFARDVRRARDVAEEQVAALGDEWNAADAEAEPADAEPWVSSGLTARWGWPIIEGFPSDSPAAGFARADSLAAADAVSAPRPAPQAPRQVPPPPQIVVPRAAPAPIPSITVPRPAPALPTLTVPRAAVAAAAPRANGTGAKSGRPEWSELVASLRKDIERRRVEPPQEKPKPRPNAVEAVPPAPAPAPVPVSASVQVPAPVMRRSRRSKPIQDEWGFFDPEQCGFAALLAKLDEITEGAEETDVRQRT